MSTHAMTDRLERQRILLVDDDVDAVRMIAHQIRSHFGQSVEVYESLSSAAAEKVLQYLAIDLVITDLDMMDVNGFHILKSVKSREPLTQVIVVTGYTSPNAIRSALSMRADEYFIKPTQANELVTAIEYLLNRVRRWKQTVNDLEQDSVQNGC
jgi:DNA-binding response OmpR family regulator